MSLGFTSDTRDFETDLAKIVCDPPAVAGVVNRVEYLWNPVSPGLSNPRISYDPDSEQLVFSLTSADTAGMVAGHWDIYCLAGEPSETQDDVSHYDLFLYDARGGAMPIT